MIEKITKKKDWDALISKFEKYDTYHTHYFHSISCLENETPILIKYTHNDLLVCIPLIIRDVPNTNYKDATSVYGYSGPLLKGDLDRFDQTLFATTFMEFLTENNIITVFSRLNPYIPNQNKLLVGLGDVIALGEVVNIDLKLDLVYQRQNYHRRLKNHVNKSRRHCGVRKATSLEDIELFIEIYVENMTRVKAKKSYFFDNSYYYNLFESKGFETEILLAYEKETDKVIAGAMFFKTNNIIQYHLSGTKDDYLHLMPTKLLIDEMRIKATEEGYTIFNLGGGLEANGEDSLFKFKSSFSKDYHLFHIWKLIINENVYNELILKNKITDLDSNFFPLYRLNDNL